MAAALQARGVAPGDRVAVLAPTSRRLATALQASWLTGAAVTVLPLRTRLTSEEAFWRQSRERVALVDATLTIAADELTGGLDGLAVTTLSELAGRAERSGPERYERPGDDPDAAAIIQFTGGSTADPKGVVIPHRCLADNLDGIQERRPLEPEETIVSWLPLYHDMGLICMLVRAMTTGVGLAIARPEDFISAPGRWLEWMAALGGATTLGPNFAFAVAARVLAHAERLDLSACRHLGNGSEPIDPAVMRTLAAEGALHRLDPDSLYGAYGMAEATVAISTPASGTGFQVDVVDAEAFATELRADPVPRGHRSALELARVGAPLPRMHARIVDPDGGEVLGERRVGEIEVRGPSVVPCYFRRPDATAVAFHDGWLRSGDLGYLAEGDLVIAGRIKDTIVVGGRNVLPQDLERAAQSVAGVRPGAVVAFGARSGAGPEHVVIAAEFKGTDDDRARRDLVRVVGDAAGLRPADVVLVTPGSLPKTSAGKLQRGVCRGRYVRGELAEL